ncbi:MAG: 4Fe-4S dicluster domain-containing protein [Candidatus Latescibacterota bacterium]
MKLHISSEAVNSALLQEAERISGQNISQCYQCGKCSAGCPIAFEMDHPPNQIMRMLQLGMRDDVLQSRAIWLCASCETCTTRCPREVDLAAIMDALRMIALREGVPLAKQNVSLFNEIFLGIIRRYGRVFEGELIGRFNLGSLQPFKDVFKAPKLLRRGKMSFMPVRSDVKTIKKIFDKIKALRNVRRGGSGELRVLPWMFTPRNGR